MHGEDMEEEEATEGKSDGGHPTYRERNLSNTPSEVAMVNGEQPVASSSSGKSEGAIKQRKEATEEEEGCALKSNHVSGDRATSTELPSMEETGSTAGALKPP